MNVRGINLWKYWGEPNNLRDFHLIDIVLYDNMSKGTRIVLFNVGLVIRW